MRYLSALLTPALLVTLGACTTSPSTPESAAMLAEPNEALLLVSLDDGTVIKQTIASDADLCFKQNALSSTICLTQGAAIIDPDTNVIVGFEMIEDRIDLVAKSD
jgi:hypothetical protein